ncbi:MAG: Stk1 family PASTA domain-containing Ser/Thr kinase [Sporichthyaceae bacterium]
MSTAVDDPLVGQLLDGRYRVARRLARGGMATVYEALDTRLNRVVAVKVMHPGFAEDRAFVARFIREAHAAARLSHPCAVAVYDQSADGGHVFIAMEYVAGRTLRDWLADRGRLTPRETFAVLEPVLAALAAAHQAGLVHRDVKPENVLIADDGRVKVADFGLARAVSNATSTGALIGTVAYLAPELVERGVADRRSDIYSVGILLYECLTGAQPHHGETPLQIAYAHVNVDVPPPSDLRRGLAPELDDLVARATSRNPAGRPADAGEFLAEVLAVRRALSPAELDDVAGDAPTVAMPRSAPADAATAAIPRRGRHTAPIPAGASAPNPTQVIPVPPTFARRRMRGRVAFVVVLALAVLVGIGGWRLAVGDGLEAPRLINLTQAEAQTKLDAAGLDGAFEEQFSENVAKGSVIGTDPPAGNRIDRGATMTVVISLGPERFKVPVLAKVGLEVARDRIEDANLKVGTIDRQYSDSVPDGSVISSDPAVGTELRRGAAVSLVLSQGGRPVDVPNVVGSLLDDAKRQLDALGLKVRTVEVEFTDDLPAGYVVAQDPTGGRLSRGQTVTLQIAKGPALVTVPNLIGLGRNEARRVLDNLNLEAEFDGGGFGLFGGGNRVTGQDLAAGSQVPEGTTVRLQLGG